MKFPKMRLVRRTDLDEASTQHHCLRGETAASKSGQNPEKLGVSSFSELPSFRDKI
jgi:hypothetical protein